jgi:uncharacterized protein YoaH (UPF0181 family)
MDVSQESKTFNTGQHSAISSQQSAKTKTFETRRKGGSGGKAIAKIARHLPKKSKLENQELQTQRTQRLGITEKEGC